MDDRHQDDIELSPLLESLAEEYAQNPKSRKFLPLAEEYRKSRMYDEAVYLLREGLKNHPDFLPARIALARCLVDMEEWEEAYDLLTDINEDSPNNIPVLRMIGEAYLGLGDFTAAAETFKTVLKLNPEDRVARDKLASIEEEFQDEIDISSLETPLFVPKTELGNKDSDEEEPDDLIEDDLELDLQREERVNIEHLTLKEPEEEEISEISISLDSDSEEFEAQQGQDALRSAVEAEQDEDIISLELDEEEEEDEDSDVGIFELGDEDIAGEEEAVVSTESVFDESDESESLELELDALDEAEAEDAAELEEMEALQGAEVSQAGEEDEETEAEFLSLEMESEEALEEPESAAEIDTEDVAEDLQAGVGLEMELESESEESGLTADEDDKPAISFGDEPFETIDEEDISELEAAMAFDSPDILAQQEESMENIPGKESAAEEKAAGEYLQAEEDESAHLQVEAGTLEEDEDVLELSIEDSLGIDDADRKEADESGESLEFQEPAEEAAHDYETEDDEGWEVDEPASPPAETTEEESESGWSFTEEAGGEELADELPQEEIEIISLNNLPEDEQAELEADTLSLSVDDIESQGRPPSVDDFISDVSQEDESGIFELNLEDEEGTEDTQQAAADREALLSDMEEQFDEPVEAGEQEAFETAASEPGEPLQTETQPDHVDYGDENLIPITASSARVFRDQGDLHKARDIYEKLILKHPEEDSYRQALREVTVEIEAAEANLEEDPEVVIEVLENWLENIRLYKESFTGDEAER